MKRSAFTFSGRAWRTALARALHCDPRLVRHWLAGDRRVSWHATILIVAMVRDKHVARLRRTKIDFLHMVSSVSDAGVKAHLLEIDLTGLRVDDQLRRANLTGGQFLSRSQRRPGRAQPSWITGAEIEEALRETAAQLSERPIIDQICETVAQLERDRAEWFKAFADSFERDAKVQLDAFPEIYERACRELLGRT